MLRQSGLRQAMVRLADSLMAPALMLSGPILKRFAHHRRQLPRASAAADRAGFSIIQRNYYSPLVCPEDLVRPLNQPRNLPGIRLDLDRQRQFLDGMDYEAELRAFPMTPQRPDRFAFGNDFFAAGDAEILYCAIRKFRPRCMIEIGSGWSTLIARAAMAANCAEGEPEPRHICIEPYEAPWLEATGATILRQRVETLDPALFDQLEANDILFIDSSHVVRAQSDVVFEFLEVLPRLRPGVLVQVHDIFTPRDYPSRWVIEDRRIWCEQYLLEAFLTGNPDWEVVCALNWLANDHRALLTRATPILLDLPKKQPGSFWIQRARG